jgi:hypothetical protein
MEMMSFRGLNLARQSPTLSVFPSYTAGIGDVRASGWPGMSQLKGALIGCRVAQLTDKPGDPQGDLDRRVLGTGGVGWGVGYWALGVGVLQYI